MFNGYMLMNYKNYQVHHLNALIHGLMRAMNFYSYYIQSDSKSKFREEAAKGTYDSLY